MIEKKTITQQLRELHVGESIDFPIEKSTSVKNTIYSNLMPERSGGARWSVCNSVEEGIVKVSRVQ